jgi:hypothetical protein
MTYKIISKNPKTSSIVIEVGSGKDAHRIDVRVPAVVSDTREVEVKTTVPSVDGEPDTELVEVITESFERETTLEDVHALLEATAQNVLENKTVQAEQATIVDVFAQL